MPTEDGVVPSGSIPVDNVPDKDNTDDRKADDGKAKEEAPYLGDWKDRSAAEKGLGELQKVMGRQGAELGALKAQNKELLDALAKTRQQASGGGNDRKGEGGAEVTQSGSLAALVDEYAKLDFFEDEEAPQKGAQIFKKALDAAIAQANEAAGSQVQDLLAKRDMAAMKEAFVKENPDFLELQKSGEIQALVKENPMHDDFSAFFALKANAHGQKASELETALADAKKVAELAGGTEGASRVFTKPGGNLRDKKNIPKTRAERKQSAINAVRKARQGP